MDSLANYLGTIDLNKRKVIRNPDGSISTEKSFGVNVGGDTEILIPQIVNGVLLSKPAATDHFIKTGEHLGAFDTTAPGFSWEKFGKYSTDLHDRQDAFYNGKPLGLANMFAQKQLKK